MRVVLYIVMAILTGLASLIAFFGSIVRYFQGAGVRELVMLLGLAIYGFLISESLSSLADEEMEKSDAAIQPDTTQESA